MYKIILGALIHAIAICSHGTHYIFKMFSFNTLKTIELLQIACLFFEKVNLNRILSTKSQSGEIYVVCLNFNYQGNMNEALNNLIKYMENDDKLIFILSKFNDKFLDKIINHHKLLTLRRITATNSFIFRFNNYDYANKNPECKMMVKSYANYYANYFLILLNLKK